MTKEDFNVRIDDDNCLVVSREKKNENKDEKHTDVIYAANFHILNSSRQ